jgi:predicted nucleotide-binding protein
VKDHLERSGLDVRTIGPENLTPQILAEVTREMAECAAIVAVCSGDDRGAKKVRRPRQNVVFEIGMAVGSIAGLGRLIVLWEEEVEVPSDLGGVLRIDYSGNPYSRLPALDAALRTRGVDLKGS